jgi:O-antigen/teichoic acid export membrane protein
MRRSTILLLAARIASATSTLVVLSLIGHLAGAEHLGRVALGLAGGQILVVMTELGLAGFMIREASRRPSEAARLWGALLAIRAVVLPIVLVVAGGLLAVGHVDGGATIWCAGAGLTLQSTADLTRAISLSQLRTSLAAIHGLSENVAWVIVVSALLLVGTPPAFALAAGLMVLVISIAIGIAVVQMQLGIRPTLPTLSQYRELLRGARAFSLLAVLATVQARLDTILVGLLLPASSVVAAGAYFTSLRLLAAIEYLPETISLSLLAEVSRAHMRSREEVTRVLQRPARLLLHLALPTSIGVFIFGPALFTLAFGRELAGFAWIVVALSPLIPVRFFIWIAGSTLTGTDEQHRRVSAAFTAGAALVALDVALIPLIGLPGAVVGAATATAIVAAAYARGIRQIVWNLWPRSDITAVLAASIGLMTVGIVAKSFAGEVAGAVIFSLIALIYVHAATGGIRSKRRASGSPRPT